MTEAISYFENLEKRLAFLETQIFNQQEPSLVTSPPSGVMNINELVSYLGDVSKGTVYQWLHRSYIPCFKIGKRVYFSQEAIDVWIQDKKRLTIAQRVDAIRTRK
jgi:excisionase family DNA binding protein